MAERTMVGRGDPDIGTIDAAAVAPGLADPVHDGQACFRAVLDAMAHPARIVTLPFRLAAAPPPPLGAAAAALALSLCDFETPIWLDAALRPAADYLRFHCGSPLTSDPAAAHFAFAGDPVALPPLDAFALGTDEYPDRSTTLILAVAALEAGRGVTLSGPGIDGAARLAVEGLSDGFWAERAGLRTLLPRGLDIALTQGDRLAALPRSTRALA
jgi:alpha-D-ribose 1-methylphosphonate 5-triphosphate synthase subunit PhnH